MITVTSVTPDTITRLAFRRRFTLPERIAIESAAQSSAAVRVLVGDMAAAEAIRLNDPDTIAGIGMLESEGLIAAGRADEILNAPIQPIERPSR